MKKQTVLITGTSSGIGLELSKTFANQLMVLSTYLTPRAILWPLTRNLMTR